MVRVLFHEKPGCLNNTKQKRILASLGHEVVERNLLSGPWRPQVLKLFFGRRPVAEWFNRAAPRVKSGEVDPAALNEAEALDLMVADPLLIRRPLLETPLGYAAGFEPGPDLERIGIDLPEPDENVVDCPKEHAPCPTPAS